MTSAQLIDQVRLGENPADLVDEQGIFKDVSAGDIAQLGCTEAQFLGICYGVTLRVPLRRKF